MVGTLRFAHPTKFEYASSISRHHLPEVLHEILALKIRGRREDRVRAAPAVPQAVAKEICCLRAYRFSGEHPAFPAQWLYGLYEIVLVTGFLATIAGLRLSPLASLTPAPGRRTQSISPYAKAALVSRDPASTAPCPSFATMANALRRNRMRDSYFGFSDIASDLF